MAAIVCLCYAVYPYESNPFHHALFLSYPLPKDDLLIPSFARNDPNIPQYYGKGPADLAFVAFYIVVLSFTREFLMQRVIEPWGLRCGIKSRAKRFRFMEQMYTAVYFTFAGPLGLYVMSRTPVWYFDTNGMYETFPHRSHEGLFKAYYLLQASYWAQQAIVLVLGLEARRKDFKELVAHHIVTLALIGLSYRFHFTYMGLAVYITHDISDFFLAVSLANFDLGFDRIIHANFTCLLQTSKSLHYVDSRFTVPYFSFFITVWVYMRHYINLKILYSLVTTYSVVGPFELNWETQQYKCWISQYITFTLLAFLQAINLFWLVYILKIALNMVIKDDLKDERSDEEYSDEEEEEKHRKGEKAKLVNPTANGKSKTPLPVGISSALESAPNGSAIESGPNTPNTPSMNGKLEPVSRASDLKKR